MWGSRIRWRESSRKLSKEGVPCLNQVNPEIDIPLVHPGTASVSVFLEPFNVLENPFNVEIEEFPDVLDILEGNLDRFLSRRLELSVPRNVFNVEENLWNASSDSRNRVNRYRFLKSLTLNSQDSYRRSLLVYACEFMAGELREVSLLKSAGVPLDIQFKFSSNVLNMERVFQRQYVLNWKHEESSLGILLTLLTSESKSLTRYTRDGFLKRKVQIAFSQSGLYHDSAGFDSVLCNKGYTTKP